MAAIIVWLQMYKPCSASYISVILSVKKTPSALAQREQTTIVLIYFLAGLVVFGGVIGCTLTTTIPLSNV
jgi:hypothetical protein